ncbi:LuxR C-terminal-related transcriptional regulator, partial [Nocardia cerradoensis]
TNAADGPIGHRPSDAGSTPLDVDQVLRWILDSPSTPVDWQQVGQVPDDVLLASAADADVDLDAIRRRWGAIAEDYVRSGWRTGGGLLFRGDTRPLSVPAADGFVPLSQRDGKVVYTTVRVNRAGDYGESVMVDPATSQWTVVHRIYVVDAPGGFGVVDENGDVVSVHWPGGLRNDRILGCFEIPAEIWQRDFAAQADRLRQYWRPNPTYRPLDTTAAELPVAEAVSAEATPAQSSAAIDRNDPRPARPENPGTQPDDPVGARPSADRAVGSAARQVLAELLSAPVPVVVMGAVRSAVDAVRQRIAEAPDDVLAAVNTSELIAWIAESLDLHHRIEAMTRKSASTDALPPDQQDRLDHLRQAFVATSEALSRRLDRMFGSDSTAPLATPDADDPLRELRRLAEVSNSAHAAALVDALTHYFATARLGDSRNGELANPELAAAAARYRDLQAAGFTGRAAQKDVAKVAGTSQTKVSQILRRPAAEITADQRIILIAARWLDYPMPEDLVRAAAQYESDMRGEADGTQPGSAPAIRAAETSRLRDELATAYRELEHAEDSNPLAESISRATPSRFDEHFRALSPIQRRILKLRYQQGLAPTETAEELNSRGWAASTVTPHTVRAAEAGALRRLAGLLSPNETPAVSDHSRERQQTLLRLIAHGVSWSGVIEQTGWSRATGRSTYSQLLRTLDVTKRVSMVPEAVRRGLLDITELPAVPVRTPAVSPDEHTLLFLVATGLSNRAIAETLTAVRGVPVGKDAVTKRVQALGRRIGIGDRAGMVAAAIRAGWLDVNADDWPSRTGIRGTAVPLSAQELRTLSLIVSGRTDDQIAAELNTTRPTAVTYRNRIFVKLGVHSREDAVIATFTNPELIAALPDSASADIRAIADVLRMVEQATEGREAGQPQWRRTLVHQLRHAILSGDVAAGRALPSARLLMQRLDPEKIQASTVRGAYRQLRDEGYLAVVRGRPTVTPRDSWPVTTETIRTHFADRIFDLATRTVGAASGSVIAAQVCARAARGAETSGRTVAERVDVVARNVIAEHRPAAEFLRRLGDFVLRGAGLSKDDALGLVLANVSTDEVRHLRAELPLNQQLRLDKFWPARRDSTAPRAIPTDPMAEPLELWSAARIFAILLAERHGVTVSLPMEPTGRLPWRILDNRTGEPSAVPTVDFRLTPDQRRLVRLLAQDLTYREIAAELGISVNSVKSRVADVARELHGEGRAELVEIARRSGLLDDTSSDFRAATAPQRRTASPVAEPSKIARRAGLSNRESHVLALSEQGLSKREIAAQLGIAPHTVEDHLGSARRKIRRTADLAYPNDVVAESNSEQALATDETGRENRTGRTDPEAIASADEEPDTERPDQGAIGAKPAPTTTGSETNSAVTPDPLPADTDPTPSEKGLADAALAGLQAYFGSDADARTLLQEVDTTDVVGASRAHTGKVARWWQAMSTGLPDRPNLPSLQVELGLSDRQYALLRVHPHAIGNADGIPFTVRDKANRLSIARDIRRFLQRRPKVAPHAVAEGAVGIARARALLRRAGADLQARIPNPVLTRSEFEELRNLLDTGRQLRDIEAEAARLTGRPPVQLLAYDAAAHDGNGRVILSIGDADRAEIVNRMTNGLGSTMRKLHHRSQYAQSLYEITTRRADGAAVAAIVDIGYRCPVDLSVASPQLAEVGGDIVARDITAFNATREFYAEHPGGVSVPRLRNVIGHSYGSTTLCYAAQDMRLAREVDRVILTGSPGAGRRMRHADEFGAPVFVLSEKADPVANLGAHKQGRKGRYANAGLGISPAAAIFGATVLATEVPVRGRYFAQRPGLAHRLLVKPHASYYLWADETEQVPGRGLDNLGWVLVGHPEHAERAEHPSAQRPHGKRWRRKRQGSSALERDVDAEAQSALESGGAPVVPVSESAGTDRTKAGPTNPIGRAPANDNPQASQVYHRLLAQLGDPRIARDLAAKAHARAEREQPTDPDTAADHLLHIADDILAEHRTAMAQLDDAMDHKPAPGRRQRLTHFQHGGLFFHNQPDEPRDSAGSDDVAAEPNPHRLTDREIETEHEPSETERARVDLARVLGVDPRIVGLRGALLQVLDQVQMELRLLDDEDWPGIRAEELPGWLGRALDREYRAQRAMSDGATAEELARLDADTRQLEADLPTILGQDQLAPGWRAADSNDKLHELRRLATRANAPREIADLVDAAERYLG